MQKLGRLTLVTVAVMFGLVRATGAQTAALSGVIVYWSGEPWERQPGIEP